MLSQTNTPESDLPRLLASGFDSLYVSYFLDFATSAVDFAQLAYEQQRLKDIQENDFKVLNLGTETLALLPHGQHPYRFVFECDAFRIAIAERMQPSCYVQFLSKGLWRDGVHALRTRLDAWFASMNLKPVRREIVSRADYAFDYDVPECDFRIGDFVSRASKDAGFRGHGRPQTFVFGTGQTVARIYDKVAEIEEQSRKYWFYDIWQQGTNVWRVEFQVRSKRLQEIGIRTLDDLDILIRDLLHGLATNHTTLRRPNGDTNRSRWPLHPLWLSLIRDIEAGSRTGTIGVLSEKNSAEYRREKIVRSQYGNLAAFAALEAVVSGRPGVRSLEETLYDFRKSLAFLHSVPLWEDAIERKIQAYRLGKW